MPLVNHICGIYFIVCKANCRIYVGSAVSISRRWYYHRSSLRGGYHPNQHLQRAWDKYGAGEFEFVIVEICHSDELLKREQVYINMLQPFNERGFNITPEAGATRGRKLSPEHRAKISAAGLGRPCKTETREKLSEQRKGKPRPPEMCARLSEANKGKASWFYAYLVTDPDGNTTEITNLKQFCKEHNLGNGSMVNVANGKRPSHKGWKVQKLGNKRYTPKDVETS